MLHHSALVVIIQVPDGHHDLISFLLILCDDHLSCDELLILFDSLSDHFS
jgi:hypothetical protein